MREIELVIGKELNNKTVKSILSNHLKLSDNLVTDLKKGDFIFVNNKSCTVRKTVGLGDVIRIVIPEFKASEIEGQSYNLNVIFEDDDVLAVNKPADTPTHTSKYHLSDTLANYVCGYMGDAFVFRTVTRLDKDTTGIVLIAKNRYSAEMLNRQMRNGEIHKEYIAICDGVIQESFFVQANIKKQHPKGIKRVVSDDGKYAVTNGFPIKSKDSRTLVRLIPQTGRTHQLRVHMSHIGHPLCGDYLYGSETTASRTMLHCEKLEFSHPASGEIITVTADIPEDFFIK